jgi:hypothetical protein
MAWEVNADSVELVGGKRNEQGTMNPNQVPNNYQQGYQQGAMPSYQQPYPQQNFEVLNDPNIQLPF